MILTRFYNYIKYKLYNKNKYRDIKRNFLNYIGIIIFDNYDIINYNYISYITFYLNNNKNILDIINIKNRNYFINNIDETILYNKLSYDFKILNNITFYNNINYKVKILYINKKFVLFIYDFDLCNKSYNLIQYNNFLNYKYVINYNFIKLINNDIIDNIINEFYLIILNKNLDIIYINNKFKYFFKLFNINKYYNLKDIINDSFRIDTYFIYKKVNIISSLELKYRTINVIYKIYNDFIYIISYDDIISYENNIIHSIYSDNSLHFIKKGIKPPPIIYNNITILFLDIVEYTKKCELLQLNDINILMNNFHSLINKYLTFYNISKIETKGDCYLCICGINKNENDKIENQLTRIVDFSTDIIKDINDIYKIDIRIGVHYGDVIVSYIGNINEFILKTIYGDDVNIAARMEQTSYINHIHLSKEAFIKYKIEKDIKDDKPIKNITYKNLKNLETYIYNPYIKDFI